MIDRVLPAAELQASAEAFARTLAGGPTLAFGVVKQLADAYLREGVPGANARLLDSAVSLFDTDDARTRDRDIRGHGWRQHELRGSLTTVPEIPSRPTADDVVIGYDGNPRCSWAGAGDTASARYDDEVRGTRTYDESALFEALTLAVFEPPRYLADLPTSTPQAEAFATQLKSQGYRFVGPTSVYALMQNVGVVNDHLHGCFRATDYRATTRTS